MHIAATPDANDILPRSLAFSGNIGELASAIQPWLTRNPRFTQHALLELVGLSGPSDAKHMIPAWARLSKALRLLGVVHNKDQPPRGPIVYFYPGVVTKVLPDVTARISMFGFSERPDAPPPPADQVEMCRAWIREFCRPRLTPHPEHTATKLVIRVMEWSRSLPGAGEKMQYDHVEKKMFRNTTFRVETGALMEAALLEGYEVHRIPDTANAIFSMAVRRLGHKWRGPTPKTKETKVITFELEKARKLKLQTAKQRAKQKFAVYLDKLLAIYKADSCRENEPIFSVRQAGKAMGITVHALRPPKMVIDVLKEAGCVSYTFGLPRKQDPDRHWKKLPAQQARRWFRFRDMPITWRMAHAELQPDVDFTPQEPTLQNEPYDLTMEQVRQADDETQGFHLQERTRYGLFTEYFEDFKKEHPSLMPLPDESDIVEPSTREVIASVFTDEGEKTDDPRTAHQLQFAANQKAREVATSMLDDNGGIWDPENE